ncbi:hypothetical protein FJK98_32090 [Micromonospora sp. HM134]|nr:hypothetical protein FJK98_32090 [Micromonospora sp. HM134]
MSIAAVCSVAYPALQSKPYADNTGRTCRTRREAVSKVRVEGVRRASTRFYLFLALRVRRLAGHQGWRQWRREAFRMRRHP